MHQIGVGVLGPVYRTYDPAEDRLVAVKAFHLDLTPEQAASLVEALTEVVDAALSHPAIVAPIAAGIEDGVPYLAQEYVAAESLDVAMRHYAPASAETALRFITQMGEAIDTAHERGVTHGALHLRDIFVTAEEARATGFGIVHALEKVGLRGPIRRPYTSPELIAGRPWGGEADRFALASIAYELLTGKRAAGTGEQVTERLDAIPDVDDRDALRQVFATALADAPESRYSSAAGLVVALRTAIGVEAAPTAAGTAAASSASPAVAGAGAEETISDLLANLELNPTEGASAPIAPARTQTPEPALSRADTVAREAVDVGEPEPGPPVFEPGFDDEIVSSRLSPETDLTALDRSLAGIEALDSAVRDRSLSGGDAPDDSEAPIAAEPERLVADVPDRDRIEPDLPLGADVDQTGEVYAPETVAAVDTGAADAAYDPFEQSIPGALGRDVADTRDADVVDDDEIDLEPASPWSPRAMAPIALAIAVGTLAAYLVWLGIGSRGDGAVTDEPEPAVLTEAISEEDPLGAGEEAAAPVVALADETPREEIGQAWSEAAVDTDADADAEDPVAANRPTPLGVPPAPALVEQTTTALPAPAVAAPRPAAPAVSADPAPLRPVPSEATANGWLLVRTNPPGATVRVDGVDRGRTPLSLQDVPFGAHRVAISQAGYEGRTREVYLSAAAAVAAVSVDLVPDRAVGTRAAAESGAGSIFVDSRPPDARVLVDDRMVGTTPVLVPDLAPGSHRVRIERAGYRSWVTTVAVPGAERVRVAASLERMSQR